MVLCGGQRQGRLPIHKGKETSLLSVQEFLDLDPWFQCRVVMSTTQGEAWTLPDMDAVSWGMEETVFTTVERTELQAYGQPLNLGSMRCGVIGLSRSVAVEWAPLGIRVNCVCPWMARTPLLEAAA